MSKTPLVSVIVPAYNAEDTIEGTLKLLADQTLESLEVIVVDDGSKDKTYHIASEFAQKNKQFRVFRQPKNGGAGKAKNFALSKCKGEFIGFCDADDRVPDDYYEMLYKAIQDSDAELAIANLNLEFEDGHTQPMPLWHYTIMGKAPHSYRFAKDKTKPCVIPNEVVTGFWADASAPTMLFKKELIEKFPFYDVVCDDIPAVIPSVVTAKKIVYVPNLYYSYVQRSGSLEHQDSFSEKRLYIVDAVGMALERIGNSAMDIINQSIVCNHLFAPIVNMIRQVPIEQRECVFSKLYTRLKTYPNLIAYLSLKNNQIITETIESYPKVWRPLYIKVLQELLEGNIAGMLATIASGEGQITNEKPLVSIIIPVYNGANYMREAINSALCQDYPAIEVIVVNDGSKDGGATDAIAKSYKDRIRYISKPNGGVSTALNAGIKAMKGEYFSWLSHDDLYKPDKVSKQVQTALEQEDRTKVIVSGTEAFDSATGNILMVSRPLDMYTKEQLEKPLFGVFHGLINGCALLIHKSHFERVGLFDEELKTTQDYDMWLRMMRGQEVIFTNDVLVRSRSHPEQESKVSYHQRNSFDLWKMMIDSTTAQERIDMCGTEKEFYKEVYTFLTVNTPFHDAALYALKGYFSIVQQELLNPVWQMPEWGRKNTKRRKGSRTSSSLPKVNVLSEIPVETLKKLLILTKEWKDQKAVVAIKKSCGKKTYRIYNELALRYPTLFVDLDANHEFELKETADNVYTLQIPATDTPDLLMKILMLVPAQMILISMDTEMIKLWKKWDVLVSDYTDCVHGIILEADFSCNRHVLSTVSKSDFVIIWDEDTRLVYRCMYSNLIDGAVGSLNRIVANGTMNYLLQEEGDMEKALQLYCKQDDENCLILECKNNVSEGQTVYVASEEAELMRNTLSWRITKPLRMLRAWQIGIKNRKKNAGKMKHNASV